MPSHDLCLICQICRSRPNFVHSDVAQIANYLVLNTFLFSFFSSQLSLSDDMTLNASNLVVTFFLQSLHQKDFCYCKKLEGFQLHLVQYYTNYNICTTFCIMRQIRFGTVLIVQLFCPFNGNTKLSKILKQHLKTSMNEFCPNQLINQVAKSKVYMLKVETLLFCYCFD